MPKKSFFLVSVTLALISLQTWACYAPPESWRWSDEKLVWCTDSIILGTFDGKQFTVNKTLKGSQAVNSKISVTSSNNNTDPYNEVGITPACGLSTKFKKNHTYLIFHHSHHQKGYLESKGAKDQWYKAVKKMVSKNKNLGNCHKLPDRPMPIKSEPSLLGPFIGQ